MGRLPGQIRPTIASATLCLTLLLSHGQTANTPRVHPQPQTPPRFRISQWTSDNSLPNNKVQVITQTRDGYLWIGTLAGLARFDGLHFTIFSRENTPAMVDSDGITSVAEDEAGRLYAGTTQGLLVREKNEFKRFMPDSGLPHRVVLSLTASRLGGVWIGTDAGLARLHNNVFQRDSPPPPLPASAIHGMLEASDGTLWLGTLHGLFRFNPASGKLEQPYDGAGSQNIRALHEDRAGRIWFGLTDGHGLGAWVDGKITIIPAPRHVGHREPPRPAAIWEDRSGRLWVAVSNGPGLHQLIGRELVAFRPTDSPIQRLEPEKLFEDREGNLWLGTEFDGLLRISPLPIQTLSLQDSTDFNDIKSVCEASDGSLWAGTSQGVVHWQKGQASVYRMPSVTSAVLMSQPSEILAAESSGRITSWTGTHFLPNDLNGATGGSRGYIHALYKDSKDAIWVGAHLGLLRWHKDVLTHWNASDGLAHSAVSAILQDNAGFMWIGTRGGLTSLSNGVFRSYPSTNGLAHEYIRCFHQTQDNTLWIGTSGGLNRFKEGEWFTYTIEQGLVENMINMLLDDGQGNLWMGGDRGIYRLSWAELNDVADGTVPRLKPLVYGEADGMLRSETNGGFQPNGAALNDGRLAFPTIRGVVIIDPTNVYLTNPPPPVLIQEVYVGGNQVLDHGIIPHPNPHPDVALSQNSASGNDPPITTLRLGPSPSRSLELRYTTISPSKSEKVRFRYRLHGHDHDWREDNINQRMVFYPDLHPGEYTFQVQAANHRGRWNEQGASLAIIMDPAFFQTKPFYLLCTLFIVALFIGWQRYRWVLQRNLLRVEQRAALDRQRAQLAQDMHDDIGSNLSQIAILSEVASRSLNNPAQAKEHMDRISANARVVIDNISELVWATSPKSDPLDHMVGYFREYAARYFEFTQMQCTTDFPESIPSTLIKAESRRDLFLAFKEALHNVLKHAEATEVLVRLQFNNPQLIVHIQDNGRGFDVAKTCPNQTTASAPQKCHGLSGMRQRLSHLGGKLLIHSQPGQGTRIDLVIPHFS